MCVCVCVCVCVQGRLENLRGPGKDIKVCPPHVMTVLLEYIDPLGPPAEWGPGQNAPVAPPPVGCPVYVCVYACVCECVRARVRNTYVYATHFFKQFNTFLVLLQLCTHVCHLKHRLVGATVHSTIKFPDALSRQYSIHTTIL